MVISYKRLRTGTKYLPIRSGRRTTGIWIGGKVGKGKFLDSSSGLSSSGRKRFSNYAYKVKGKTYYDLGTIKSRKARNKRTLITKTRKRTGGFFSRLF